MNKFKQLVVTVLYSVYSFVLVYKLILANTLTPTWRYHEEQSIKVTFSHILLQVITSSPQKTFFDKDSSSILLLPLFYSRLKILRITPQVHFYSDSELIEKARDCTFVPREVSSFSNMLELYVKQVNENLKTMKSDTANSGV